MTKEYQPLTNENDAIELKNEWEKFFLDSSMFKLKDFIYAIKCKFLHLQPHQWEEEKHDWAKHRKKWLSEGMDCEILQLGSYQWKKGRLRINITVEFAPDDEADSPLDDVRKGS